MTTDDLRREIAASRRDIQQDYAALKIELDFATKARRSVAERPLPWLGGAALVGYFLSGRKKAKAARKRKDSTGKEIAEPAKKLTLLGVALTLIRIGFPLARPALTAFAVRKLGSYASRFAP